MLTSVYPALRVKWTESHFVFQGALAGKSSKMAWRKSELTKTIGTLVHS